MIENIVNSTKKSKILLMLVVMLGVFFHHSQITGIGNISIADFIIILIILYLITQNKFFLPMKLSLVFLTFSAFILIISIYIVPLVFNVETDIESVVIGYLKLFASFLFLLTGFNLGKIIKSFSLIKVYSYTAVGISIIGVITSVITLPFIEGLLYRYSFRFNGFMNDPNYFAILQIAALPYFLSFFEGKNIYRVIIVSIIGLSVILSGSKTGLIVFAIFSLFKLVEKIISIKSEVSYSILLKLMSVIFLFVIFFNLVIKNSHEIVAKLSETIPVLNRVSILLEDFSGGISAGGSERDIAWGTGLEIIQLSPIVGAGIGNYLNISEKYYGVNVIAHNTYIQLYAEWGVVITSVFFCAIFIMLAGITIKHRQNKQLILLRDIIIIFLLGSIAISLNNARFFWFILGAMIFYYLKQRKQTNQMKS